MAVVLKEDYQRALEEQKKEVRELVMVGLEQTLIGCVTDWRRNTEMRRYQIRITELAEEDIENAGDYIAHKLKNPSAAERTVRGIRAKINSLADFPERNELDEDKLLAGLGVRKDYYRNYKIYYVIEKDTIYIVRILHMLVDSKAWLYRTFGV